MAFPSTFEERLHHLEQTTNQRLSLLRAETDLHRRKSLLLSASLSSLRRVQQRCRLLEQRSARISAFILAKKSEIEALEERYNRVANDHRVVRSEIGEMEERSMEKDAFLEAKMREMELFKEDVRKRLTNSRSEMQRLRGCVSELQGVVKELQGRDGYLDSSEIVEAERRKVELLETKASLEKTLASNYQLRSLLRKLLSKELANQSEERS